MYRVIRRLAVSFSLVVASVSLSPLEAETIPVANSTEFIAAINTAAPGDVIALAPGSYEINQNLNCDEAGTAMQPITVRAAALGQALIQFNAQEGFKVLAPHWTFENLDIEGVCATDSFCEHAFHVVGAADNIIIRNTRMREYNAAIKGNGQDLGEGYVFPDDVLIEFSIFANSTVRNTSNPVTPIDVVGGRRWIIRANRISDFAKGQGNGISYAAFLKGNSRDGIFERNLVICEEHHTGGVRLGLSFGGGGSGPDPICEGGTCSPEHQNGIMRNNVIINCPLDVGIYLNEAANTKIFHNTIFNTTGIDVRFTASSADVRGNLLSGSIRERNSGTASIQDNLTNLSSSDWSSWFVDPANADFSLLDGDTLVDQGEELVELGTDFCGQDRGTPDLGALEYLGIQSCDSTVAGGGYPTVFTDGFERGDLAAWR